MLDAQGRDTRTLTTVSYVFDDAVTSDERGYVNAMEESLGSPGLHISDQDCLMLTPAPDSFLPDLPSNDLCYLQRHDRLVEEMEARGSHVLLNGIGGDQLFASTPSVLLATVDLLAQRQLRKWVAVSREVAHRSHRPLASILLGGALHRFRRDACLSDIAPGPIGEWLDPSFVARVRMKERIRVQGDVGFDLPSQEALSASLRRTMRPWALERWTRTGYIDMRYPYLDRRLIEFSFAIPFDQKLRLPESRSIVRRAFRGRLPDIVRLRQTKGDPVEAVYRAVARERPQLLAWIPDLRLASYGFVNPDRFATAIQRISHGLESQAGQILPTLALEIWLYNGEDIRQFRGEFREWTAQGQELRRQLREQGVDVTDLDEILRSLKALDDDRVYKDAAELERLQSFVSEGLKRFEYSLRRKVETADQQLFLSGSDEVPAGFRDLVEVAQLRAYFDKGGFMWADDFWGTWAWEQWKEEIGRVLPPDEFPIVDLPADHPVFHTLFTVTKVPQVPNIGHWRRSGGATSERGSDSPHPNVRGISDRHGRLIVLMTHNTDIADTWEREGENQDYFYLFSPDGYAVAINVLVYAMTH